MLDEITNTIFAPFRWLRSTVFNIQQAPAKVKGAVGRAKNEALLVKDDAANLKKVATGGKETAAIPKPKKKMGLFSSSKKCPGCGQKLHASWEECPYCGWGKAGAAAPAAAAPAAAAGGAPARTMALDLNAVPGMANGIVGWLIPLEGQKAMELFELKGKVTVGKAPDNHIVIPEDSISGKHCELVGTPTGFKITDLASTNGTFVNDKRITRDHELIDNDNIRLGRIRFKFKSLV